MRYPVTLQVKDGICGRVEADRTLLSVLRGSG
jgi:hypothetical protein